MKKKTRTTFGIIAIAMIAFLGISGIVAANQGFVFSKDLTDEEKTEMQEQREAMQTAIENSDYDTWKSLMEEKIMKMQEQITKENFNKIVEMNQEMKNKQEEMKEKMEQFCEENDCPDFEDGEFPENFQGHPRMRNGFEMSCSNPNNPSE